MNRHVVLAHGQRERPETLAVDLYAHASVGADPGSAEWDKADMRSAFGLRRGAPTRPRIGGMASTRSISSTPSCTFAAVVRTTIGTPRRSVSVWCFEPVFPRSVGFGPVCAPL